MSPIALHIDRLVLEGIPLGGRGPRLVQVAVEAELTRLLSQGGLAASLHGGGALQGIAAPAIQLRGGQSPSALGRQIAGAVYRGIGR
jgi:hypothetical protein